MTNRIPDLTFRRACLQGRLVHSSCRRPEARDDFPGVRRTIETAAYHFPLDVQQFRRADERPGQPIHAGEAAQPDHQPLARLQVELYTGQRHGLRDGRLLGEKQDWRAKDAVSFSDHRRRETVSPAELHGPTVDRFVRVSNG